MWNRNDPCLSAECVQEQQPGTSKTTFPLSPPLSPPSEVTVKKLCLWMKIPWMLPLGSVWSLTDLKAVCWQTEAELKDGENCFLSEASSGSVVMLRGLWNAPATLERLVGKVCHTIPTEGLGWPQPFRRSVVLRLFMGACPDLWTRSGRCSYTWLVISSRLTVCNWSQRKGSCSKSR